jgi:hypothetical protein
MKNDAPSKTLAFVRMGPFPIPNRLLPIHLEAALPNWQVEVFDIKPEIRRKPLVLLLNLFFLLRENGLHLLGGRLTPWQAFFTTTYMFKKMSAISQRWIAAIPISIDDPCVARPGSTSRGGSTGTRRVS